MKAGWTAVERNVVIPYPDFKSFHLEIRTNSEIGSRDQVYVSQGQQSGGLNLVFTSPPTYKLWYCRKSVTNFQIPLPDATDRIWRINITRSDHGRGAGTKEVRVVIHCNDVMVVDDMINNMKCPYIHWVGPWMEEAAEIYFHSFDTASDYYRLFRQGNYC